MTAFYPVKLHLANQCILLRALRPRLAADQTLNPLFTKLCEPPPSWSDVLSVHLDQSEFETLIQLQTEDIGHEPRQIITELIGFGLRHRIETGNPFVVPVSASCGFHPIPVILPMEPKTNDIQPAN